MNKQKRMILKYTALIIWLIVIFMFSNQVAKNSSNLSGEVVRTIKPWLQSIPESLLTFLTRKAGHITLYFILGLITYSIAIEYKLRARYQVLYSWLFLTLYAMSDEFHQLFRAGRSGEPRDVLIDSVAGIVGIMIYYYVKERRQRTSSNS